MKLKDIFTPKLLGGIAVVGVVATAIVAAVEAMGSDDAVEKAKKSFPEDKEKTFLAVSAHVIPRVAASFKKTIIIGGLTITCIVLSNYLSGIQIAALTGSLAGAISQRDAIEKEVSKIPGGKEAIKKAKEEVAKMTAVKEVKEEKKSIIPWKSQSIEETGFGDVLIYDEWSGRLFRSDPEMIERQQEEFNTERDEGLDLPFSDDSEMNLPLAGPYNDLFNKYNIEPSKLGHVFGWPANDDWYPTRRIPFENYWIRLEDMDETGKKRYGEDLFVISIPDDYLPMLAWQEV